MRFIPPPLHILLLLLLLFLLPPSTPIWPREFVFFFFSSFFLSSLFSFFLSSSSISAALGSSSSNSVHTHIYTHARFTRHGPSLFCSTHGEKRCLSSLRRGGEKIKERKRRIKWLGRGMKHHRNCGCAQIYTPCKNTSTRAATTTTTATNKVYFLMQHRHVMSNERFFDRSDRELYLLCEISRMRRRNGRTERRVERKEDSSLSECKSHTPIHSYIHTCIYTRG